MNDCVLVGLTSERPRAMLNACFQTDCRSRYLIQGMMSVLNPALDILYGMERGKYGMEKQQDRSVGRQLFMR